jgi:hypothetical protein
MGKWSLWKKSEPLKTIEGIKPLLASWNRTTDPAQIRLQKYLNELEGVLGPIVAGHRDLFLDMEIDVEDRRRLLHQYDLENYLTPVVYRLGAQHFRFVCASKHVGGGSRIHVGVSYPLGQDELAGWGHFSCFAGSGTQTRR